MHRFKAVRLPAISSAAMLVSGSLLLPGSAAGVSRSYRIVSATLDTTWRSYPAGVPAGCSVTAGAVQHDTLAPGGLGVHLGGDFVDIRPNVTSRTDATYRQDCTGEGPYVSFTCSGHESHPAESAGIYGELTHSGRTYRFTAGDHLWDTSATCSSGQTIIPRPNFGEPDLKDNVQAAVIAIRRIRTGAVPRRTIRLRGHQVKRGSVGDQLRYEIKLDWSVVLRAGRGTHLRDGGRRAQCAARDVPGSRPCPPRSGRVGRRRA
jgi:hypothetical protein